MKPSSFFLKLKQAIFTTFFSIQRNSPHNQLFYMFLLIAELISLLAYSFCLPIGLDKNMHKFDIREHLVSSVLIVCYIVAGSLLMVYFVILILLIIGRWHFKRTNILHWLQIIYSFILISFLYMFFMPCVGVMALTISLEYSPWKDIGIIQFTAIAIASSFIILLAIFLASLAIFIFHDEEFNSSLPWSMSPLLVDYLKLIKKLAIICCFVFESSNKDILLLAIFVITWIQFYVVLTSPQLDKKWPRIVFFFSEIAQWLVYTTAILNELLSTILIDYPLLFFIMLPMGVAGLVLFKSAGKYNLLAKPIIELDNAKDTETYIRNLLLFAKTAIKRDKYFIISSYLHNHCNSCQLKDCPCSHEYSAIEDSKAIELIHNLCAYFIKETIRRTGRKKKLYILNAYINYFLKGNCFQAIYDLQEAEEMSSGIHEEYITQCLRYSTTIIHSLRIEKSIKKEDVSIGNNSINTIISFQETFIKFEEVLTNTANLYIKFWKEIMKDLPNHSNLINYGYDISKGLANINMLFETLIKFAYSKEKTYALYTLFLSMVAKDEISSFEKSQDGRLAFEISHREKKREGDNLEKYENAGIVIISGNRTNTGLVLSANNEFFHILDYPRKEVINNNITIVMPQLFEDVHDKFIQDYLMQKTSTTLALSRRLVFPLDSRGIIVPCNLLLKVLPDLTHGIVFAGFMTRAKYIDETRAGELNVLNKDILLILLDQKMNIHGFNKKLLELMDAEESKLNMRKYLIDRQNRSLSAIYPEIFRNVEAMKSVNGYKTEFSISQLFNIFPEELCLRTGMKIASDTTISNGISSTSIEFKSYMVNIKLKKYENLAKSFIYHILTIDFEELINYRSFQIDSQKFAPKAIKKRMDTAFEEETISQTTTSNSTP